MSKVTVPGSAQIDVLSPNGRGGISGAGSVAMKLLNSGFNVNALRPNGVLQKDEWKKLDEAVVQIARPNLRLVNDLISRGLTYSLPNALGVTRIEWERVSDITGATINMSGLSEGQNDRPEWDLQGIPVPIIHKDFQINIRALEASRNRGMPLDTTMVELATRKVAETAETLVYSGGFGVGTNGTIYGYVNHPDRNTGSTTADWNTATGAQIIADVLAMIAKAIADNQFGPYVIYVSRAAYVHLADDFKSESDRTILERVMAIPGIEAIIPTNEISDSGVAVMVQMSKDVIDLVVGMMPTVVSWESHGGMMLNFKVMAILVPRIKSDFEGKSGIVHYT